MLRAWSDSGRKLGGTPCPQHSQVLGAERKGGVRAGLQENSGTGPQPPSSSGVQPSQQSDVSYVSSPERHMRPVHGPNFVPGHMGVLRAPGRA